MTPKYLYHYTSINTLALILKNKSIRFRSLEMMDDYDEVKIMNNKLGKYCYISCWTDSEEESIPMWKMYSNDLSGVRIRLPVYPFEVYEKEGNEYIINPNEIINDKYYYIEPYKSRFLKQVSYESIEKLEKIKNEYQFYNLAYYGALGYDINLPGSYKNNYWKFQKEWRYVFSIMPTKEMVDNIDVKINLDFLHMDSSLPFRTKDLYLEQNAFSKMEITLGPKANHGDYILVEALVSKYNPNAMINRSKLSARI